ncbi:hypothetical protein [Streptomyces sp. SID3343]|uniref:hypothetical protein n=1 Tax=Streptomyces sp. SID3343 TaxID=2690260 RepID=UPI001927CEF8|nr:hypothetical protein [Streptomyces sp. SID3343]
MNASRRSATSPRSSTSPHSWTLPLSSTSRVAPGARVQCEQIELLDPDGRTSHLVARYTRRLQPAAGRHAVADTSVRTAGPGEAGVLGVAIGSVLLVVRVVRFARDGRPAAVEELLPPADRWLVRLG